MPSTVVGNEEVRQWVIDHDESWLFVGAYVTLAVVLSFYSLFWLVVVVGVHLALELGRQSARYESVSKTVAEALWEVKLDLGLIVFALALTLYLPLVFGVLGLSSAARAAAGTKAVAKSGSRVAKSGAKAARFKEVFRAVALSLDDVGLVGKGLIGGKVAQETWQEDVHEETGPRDSTSWTEPWTLASWASILFLVASTIFLVGSPLLPGYSVEAVFSTLGAEMEPFP